MLADISPEQLSAALDAVALEAFHEARIPGPPIDAVALAQALGVRVAWDDRQPGRARYVRLGHARACSPQPTILLRPDPRPERQHWAVAHEIGEHLACRAFSALGVDLREVSPRTREWLANRLAGRLLLPNPWFATDAAHLDFDLLRLKQRYRTASHELIGRRMLELAPPMILTIFDQGAISLRRSNVAGRVPPLSPVEVACWKPVHQRNRPHLTQDECLTVQGWPVHEPGWKREILRTALAEQAE